ncbi:hypothetical protein OpiT1DRAFT_03875 [Opitutaceae bacterium TAV1]|nr:hypothetical protein OpiT1DRAFT_03875 [Opitutaceae bacterium TAV1]
MNNPEIRPAIDRLRATADVLRETCGQDSGTAADITTLIAAYQAESALKDGYKELVSLSEGKVSS